MRRPVKVRGWFEPHTVASRITGKVCEVSVVYPTAASPKDEICTMAQLNQVLCIAPVGTCVRITKLVYRKNGCDSIFIIPRAEEGTIPYPGHDKLVAILKSHKPKFASLFQRKQYPWR